MRRCAGRPRPLPNLSRKVANQMNPDIAGVSFYPPAQSKREIRLNVGVRRGIPTGLSQSNSGGMVLTTGRLLAKGILQFTNRRGTVVLIQMFVTR